MESLTGIYVMTIVVSIAIAVLLVQLAKLTSQARTSFEKEKKKTTYLSSHIPVDESLKQVVYEQISEVVDSKKHCQEVSDIVTNIFSKELERKTELKTQELDKKYRNIIQQKGQSEEIAWKKYKKVLADKKETEAVIRSVAEGLLVVDGKGNVAMMNPAAEQLLGISRKDKIGKPILEDLKKEQLVSLMKASHGKEGREIEIISQDAETRKVLRSSSAVIENENGQTVGMVSVLRDITKQKELDRLKSNFVANVTHELRTPLIAVQKSISLLLNKTTGQISETQEEFLTIAARNLKKLGVLIDDLLDLSKLEAGKMALKREDVFIENVIDEAVESLNTWARTKSIAIKKQIQKEVPCLNIDSSRIGQVLNNLIGNAIKFTPEGGDIIVEATLGKNSNEVRVTVSDTGVGIEKEDLPKVFDKFYQAGGERSMTDISGTGVGLSIVKEIVELHGGKVWAESDKGRETKFIFTLPVNSEG